MEIISSEALNGLCQVLRRHGVAGAKISVGDTAVELTFGPAPVASSKVEEPSTIPTDREPDACRCGHPYYQHSPDSGCFEGCPIETCAPGTPKDA